MGGLIRGGLRRVAIVAALGLAGSGGGCRQDGADLPHADLPPPADYRVVTSAISKRTSATTQLRSVASSGVVTARRIGPEAGEAYSPGWGPMHLMGALPDGSSAVMAYQGQLFRLDLDADTTPHPLTTDVRGLVTEVGVAFDPSGTRLAYASAEGVHVLALSGEDPPLLVDASERSGRFELGFSSDGRFVLVRRSFETTDIVASDGSGNLGRVSGVCDGSGTSRYLRCDGRVLDLETMTFVPSFGEDVLFADPYIVRRRGGTLERLDTRRIGAPDASVVISMAASPNGGITLAGDRLIYLEWVFLDRERVRVDLKETSLANPAAGAVTLLTDVSERVWPLGGDDEAAYLCLGERLLRITSDLEERVVVADGFECVGKVLSPRCRLDGDPSGAAQRRCVHLGPTHAFFMSTDDELGAMPLEGGAVVPLPTSEGRWVATDRGLITHRSEEIVEGRDVFSTDLRGQSTQLAERAGSVSLVDDWLISSDSRQTSVTRVGSGMPLRPVAPRTIRSERWVLDDHLVFESADQPGRFASVPLTSEGPLRWLAEAEETIHGPPAHFGDGGRLVVRGPEGLQLVDLKGAREVISTGPVDAVSVDSKGAQVAWAEGSKVWRYREGRVEEVGTFDAPPGRIRQFDGGRYILLDPSAGGEPQQITDTTEGTRTSVPLGTGVGLVRDGVFWGRSEGDLIVFDVATRAELARFRVPGWIWHPTRNLIAAQTGEGWAIADVDGGLTVVTDEYWVNPRWTKTGRRFIGRVHRPSYTAWMAFTLSTGEVETIATEVESDLVSLPDGRFVFVQAGRIVVSRGEDDVSVLTPEFPRRRSLVGVAVLR